ncbi:NmrA family transcriptional regulator [Aspergillus insuetus]
MSKLLVVFGATGAQGGSLIKYVLEDATLSKKYRLRGVTRNASKPAAAELAAKGVEMVEANTNAPSSLTAAVQGAYALFGVTDFWDSKSPSTEIAQGKAIADAALAAGVTVMIFSSLPSISKMSNGEVTSLPQFDSKAVVEEYIRGLPFPVSVFYLAGWYMQNIWHDMAPQVQIQPDGTAIYPLPWPGSTKLPWIDITDTGKYLAPALHNPQKYNGARLTAASAYYSAQEIVETWSRVSGRTVRLPEPEEYEKFMIGPFQQSVLGGLLEYGYFGPSGEEDVQWMHGQLCPGDEVTAWEEFLVREGPWFVEL